MANIKILAEVGYASQKLISVSGTKKQVKPTYFYDPSSKNQEQSALDWAQGRVYSHNATPNAKALVRPNIPMSNLYLCDINVRMEGGRAYKVYNADDMTYFDVREDQMIQAILKYGIQAGGKIGGEWIWALNHTQMKCFLVDSVEYQHALQKHKASISLGNKLTKGFKVGHVYTGKTGQARYIYLGRFNQIMLHDHQTNKTIKAPWISKNKEHFFLIKTNKKSEYGCIYPKGYTITNCRTVYETNQPVVNQAELTKLVKLVLPNHYKFGSSGSYGYVWREDCDYSHLNITWTEMRTEDSYVADAFLNGIQAWDSLTKE